MSQEEAECLLCATPHPLPQTPHAFPCRVYSSAAFGVGRDHKGQEGLGDRLPSATTCLLPHLWNGDTPTSELQVPQTRGAERSCGLGPSLCHALPKGSLHSAPTIGSRESQRAPPAEEPADLQGPDGPSFNEWGL